MEIVWAIYAGTVVLILVLLVAIRRSADPTSRFAKLAIYRLDMILLLIVDVVLLVMIPAVTLWHTLPKHL